MIYWFGFIHSLQDHDPAVLLLDRFPTHIDTINTVAFPESRFDDVNDDDDDGNDDDGDDDD